MALMQTPRYRHLSIADLEWLVLEPLLRDRIAIASTKPDKEDPLSIHPMVSRVVDREILEKLSVAAAHRAEATR